MTLSGANTLTGRALHPGSSSGELLILDQPISFWGGVDHHGVIIDVHHPQCGVSVAGKVLVMTSGRGSSSATAVLAELIRAKKAPAAMIFTECDIILVIGALVSAELYQIQMPMVELTEELYAKIPKTGSISVDADNENMVGLIKW
jgi:predicted aconitase with swiveling domain